MNNLEALVVDISKLGLVVVLLTVVLVVLHSAFRGHAGERQPGRPAAPGLLRAPLSAAASAGSPVGQKSSQAGAEQTAVAGEEVMLAMADGESLEEFKTRLKKSAAPKKSSISAEMLDTANNYDDKVALVRMLVSEDSGRVAAVLKNMIQRDLGG